MLDARSLAVALGGEAHGNKVLAPGPGHSKEDRSLSVLIDAGAPGGFVVNSFAGDDPIAAKDYVRQRLGEPEWKPEGSDRPRFHGAIARAFRAKQDGGEISPPAARPTARQQSRFVAEYVYHDENGSPSRKVVRMEPKSFPQYRWNGSGWQIGTQGVPLFPYRLPELLAAEHDTVFICEGEKDADRLASLGFIATTNPMGAGKWTADLNRWFAGRECFILADNDDAGRHHAHDVARCLSPLASSVRVVNLPGLPPKGDVSDWLVANHDNTTLIARLAQDTPIWREGDAADKATTCPRIDATPFVWRDPASLPRRQWLYGNHLIRKYLSATVAPGGVGKSSLIIGEALAMVSGQQLLGEWVAGPLRVWLWNGEDPLEEMERRILAACQHYGLDRDDIKDRLYLDSGRDTPIKVATTAKGDLKVATPVVQELTATIRKHKIDVLLVDPFVETHSVGENDNPAINAVARQFAYVADETACAIGLVHHVRKGMAGVSEFTVDDARGASSLLAAARSGRVLNRMTKEEGERAGVENCRQFFRVTMGKANLAPAADESTWFKLENVTIPNGHLGGHGDEVGVVMTWKWPEPFETLTLADTLAVQRAFEGKQYRKDVQSPEWAGRVVADVLGLDLDKKRDRERIKGMLKIWTANGVLREVTKLDAKRRERVFLEAGDGHPE